MQPQQQAPPQPAHSAQVLQLPQPLLPPGRWAPGQEQPAQQERQQQGQAQQGLQQVQQAPQRALR